jgi:hypothetical protein
MTQRVLDERVQVVDDDIVAAADERERAGGLDEADRSARARTERDVVLQVAQSVRGGLAGRRREHHRVAHESGIDVDAEDGSLQSL